MTRALTARVAKLEASSTTNGPRQVFRVIAHDDAEQAREMDRIRADGFDPARDFVIVRRIVSPPEYRA